MKFSCVKHVNCSKKNERRIALLCCSLLCYHRLLFVWFHFVFIRNHRMRAWLTALFFQLRSNQSILNYFILNEFHVKKYLYVCYIIFCSLCACFCRIVRVWKLLMGSGCRIRWFGFSLFVTSATRFVFFSFSLGQVNYAWWCSLWFWLLPNAEFHRNQPRFIADMHVIQGG